MVTERYKRWYKRNRKSELERNRKYHQENKKKVNRRHRLRKHDVTQEEHDALLKKQKNRCAICRRVFRKTPHIDHNHKTGRNRGLLCGSCNLGIGHFKDNPGLLQSAIGYLRRFGRNRVWQNI